MTIQLSLKKERKEHGIVLLTLLPVVQRTKMSDWSWRCRTTLTFCSSRGQSRTKSGAKFRSGYKLKNVLRPRRSELGRSGKKCACRVASVLVA